MGNNDKACLIELAGHGGAGKTTFAKELTKQLNNNSYKAFRLDKEKSSRFKKSRKLPGLRAIY